jgi:hypothetical protein
VSLLVISTATANAATHIFILPESGFSDTAFADVAGEPLNADVTYTIFPRLLNGQVVSVPMNSQNFATSPDLDRLASHRMALVIARTTDPSVPSVAMLRQRSGTGARDAVTIPSSNVMLGRSFNIPLGDLTGGAAIYIGNPTAADALIDFQYGNSTAPVMTPITVSPTSVSKVVLPSTPTQTNLLINVRSDFGVVVQAVINKRSIVVMPIGNAIGPFPNE